MPDTATSAATSAMQSRRHEWLIVAAMFLGMFFVFGGGFGTSGVFFNPLLKYLGVSHFKLSLVAIIGAVLGYAAAPLIGWLLDRIDARWVVSAAALTGGCAMLLASHARSYDGLLAAMIVAAIGYAGTTAVPIGTVCANWFSKRRGLALGFIWSGFAFGGSTMVQVTNYVIGRYGWRLGYVALALPMMVIVAPLALLIVRSRPPELAARVRNTGAGDTLPGLDVREGLRTRSFWLLGIMYFCFEIPALSLIIHLVPYLISRGLTPTAAAGMLSVMWIITAISKPLMGALADRIGPKAGLTLVLCMMAGGLLCVLRVRQPPFMVLFLILYGFGVGSPTVLITMLAAEVFGLKRLGTLWGLESIFYICALGLGPLAYGAFFDRFGGYQPAFVISALLVGAAALIPFACISHGASELRAGRGRRLEAPGQGRLPAGLGPR